MIIDFEKNKNNNSNLENSAIKPFRRESYEPFGQLMSTFKGNDSSKTLEKDIEINKLKQKIESLESQNQVFITEITNLQSEMNKINKSVNNANHRNSEFHRDTRAKLPSFMRASQGSLNNRMCSYDEDNQTYSYEEIPINQEPILSLNNNVEIPNSFNNNSFDK